MAINSNQRKGKDMKTVDQLALALKAAKDFALAADLKNSEDGGTCNFDSPAFRVERARESTIEAAAKKAGVDVSSFQWYGKRWYWITGICEGQANRRSRMATAAANALKSFEGQIKGFHASCYYAID